MKKRLCLLLLILTINSYGQENFEKASFINGDLNRFIVKKFFSFSKNTDIGYGKVIVSFEIDTKGKIQNLFPEKYNTKKNVLNAILAIQATDRMWQPAKENGVVVSKKYKIVFNILKENSPFTRDVKKGLKLIEKKSYKKALKLYNKLIARYGYNLQLYQKRYKVNEALNKNTEALLDKGMVEKLKKDIMLNVTLFSKQRKFMRYGFTTETYIGRDAFLRRDIKNQ